MMPKAVTATDIKRESAKRPRGRPVENVLPEPIPDTPENIAKAIMQGPPKKKWRYLEDDEITVSD